MPEDCVFCSIAAGRAPTPLAHATSAVVAFHDIRPQMRVHLLIVPREHIPSVLDLGPEHAPLLAEMVGVARELIARLGIAGAYRLLFNGGRFQHVPHLHWHLMAP
jgi:histidine triad (HIT) family protein